MARKIPLNEGEYPTASIRHLASTDHLQAAETTLRILKKFPDIRVPEIQIPRGNSYTCWYVSIANQPRQRIINFTLQRNGAMNVEFRHMQFLDPRTRDTMQWQTGNWPYARIPTAFTAEQVTEIMRKYVPRVLEANNEGKLKRGGTSAAETVISDILAALHGKAVVQGVRPEWLGTSRGKYLQLDFYLEALGVAIEVQGIQHFKDLYGKPEQLQNRQQNDYYKARKCLERGISMIWMDAQGIQKELVKLPFDVEKKHVRELISLVKKHHLCWMVWKSPNVPPLLKPVSPDGYERS